MTLGSASPGEPNIYVAPRARQSKGLTPRIDMAIDWVFYIPLNERSSETEAVGTESVSSHL
jgi:hypothetical protein